jgi:hypothetical protein
VAIKVGNGENSVFRYIIHQTTHLQSKHYQGNERTCVYKLNEIQDRDEKLGIPCREAQNSLDKANRKKVIDIDARIIK